LEQRNARPVLSADDLAFIIDGLALVRNDLGEQAIALSKGEEFTAAGETLAMGAEVDDLVQRMEALRVRLITAWVESVDLSAEVDDVAEEADEVGTVPMEEFIEDDPNVDHEPIEAE
jgi:hypothetical protein